MALRLVEVFLPRERAELAEELVREHSVVGVWRDALSDTHVMVKVLLEAEQSEAVLDHLERFFSGSEEFRMILLPVEATLPRVEAPAADEAVPPPPAKAEPRGWFARISREELYSDIEDSIKLSWVFVATVVLSSIVAAIGILEDNVAVIIGAMVIAPLLGPNVALALATTLADGSLARRALQASVVGVATALLVSVVVGLIASVDPQGPEISSRTKVEIEDVVLALASGSAGALSFTTGVAAALIGVMVAVALLPPSVTFGVLLGSGHLDRASDALLLVVVNLISINLAGVVTFLALGVRPLTWWEANRARRATRIAVVLWGLLLTALVLVIVFAPSS